MPLVCRGLVRSRGRVTVLDGVDLSIDVGVTALLGENGAGKTTLLRVLAGLDRADGGSLETGDARVALVPQHPSSLPWLEVAEYVAYAAYLSGRSRREARDGVGELLERANLQELAHRPMTRLSGGEQRRLAIAAALGTQPDVLLLDESTVGLDPRQRDAVLDIVQEVGTDRPVMLSSHVGDDVDAVADRVLVLAGGVIRFDGTLAELEAAVTEQAGRSTLARALAEFGAAASGARR